MAPSPPAAAADSECAYLPGQVRPLTSVISVTSFTLVASGTSHDAALVLVGLVQVRPLASVTSVTSVTLVAAGGASAGAAACICYIGYISYISCCWWGLCRCDPLRQLPQLLIANGQLVTDDSVTNY